MIILYQLKVFSYDNIIAYEQFNKIIKKNAKKIFSKNIQQ